MEGGDFIGAPGKIRTPDPQIRSLVLYPAELPVLIRRKSLKNGHHLATVTAEAIFYSLARHNASAD